MSSRHLRKLQERQAEAAASQQADTSDDSDEDHPTQPARNAFDGLLDSDEEEAEDEPASSLDDAFVKQTVASPASVGPAGASVGAAGSDGQRKPSNKQRRAAKQRPEDELDEDGVLAAAAAERAASSEATAEAEAEADAEADADVDLLKLSTSHLDATNELSRKLAVSKKGLSKIVAASWVSSEQKVKVQALLQSEDGDEDLSLQPQATAAAYESKQPPPLF